MRLLAVGINYEPEETGIAPYTTGLVRHLADRGHEVTVVTGLPSYPRWRVEKGYRGRIASRERRGGVDVHRRWHYVPRRQSAVRRIAYEASFAAAGAWAPRQRPPDVVLGVVPSLSGGVLARRYANRFGVPYAVLFQDLVGRAAAQSGVDGAARVAGVAGRIESWVARDATSIGIIAEGFRRHLEACGVDPARIHRVRNWVHVGEPMIDRGSMRRRLGLPLDATICLHAGNMGYKQGLDNVVECARLAEETSLLFVLMGDGSQRAHLERAAVDLPVRFLPIQEESIFPSVLAAADILLVNQRASVTDMSLPGKLTSYFHAGRPVVAAVSAESETRREMDRAKAGLCVPPDEPAALLAAIGEMARDVSRRDELGDKGRTYARDVLGRAACVADLEKLVLGASDRAEART